MEEVIDVDEPQGTGRADRAVQPPPAPGREDIAEKRRRRLERMRQVPLQMFPDATSPRGADELLAEAEHVGV